MSREIEIEDWWFPFKRGDKVRLKDRKSLFFKKDKDEYVSNPGYPYVEVTAVGNTLFLAHDKANEHLYSKLNVSFWEFYKD